MLETDSVFLHIWTNELQQQQVMAKTRFIIFHFGKTDKHEQQMSGV